jgi:hypothetical protein
MAHGYFCLKLITINVHVYYDRESKQAFEKLNCFRAISGNSKKKRLKRGRSVRERADQNQMK